MIRLVFAAMLVAIVAVLAGPMATRADPDPVTVTVDADPDTAGVQATRAVAYGSTFYVDILIGSVSDLQAFNFELEYDQALLLAPTIASGPDVDRNPDANETFLSSTGRSWSCSPPAPSGDNDPDPNVGAAFLSCFSTGATSGPSVGPAETILATVEFNAVAVGTSSLTLRNVNTFKEGSVETGSCNPVVITAATCTGASVTVSSGAAVGGGFDFPEIGQPPPHAAHASGGSSAPPYSATAGGVAAAVALMLAGAGWLALRRRFR
jgi:hypothetical protein